MKRMEKKSKSKSNNTSKKKSNKRKTKIHLVFNEGKRREFLTGFHKRKLQRKKKAKEELEQDLKNEKKRLKAEARESYKKLVKSYAPIPEVEDLLAEEYEDDDVNVKVVELSRSEIAKQNNWIGINQPQYECDEEEEESDDGSVENEELPGMELKPKSSKTKKDSVEETSLKSKKDIKKIVKKQATKNVQNSKAYQIKNRIEKHKQRRKAIQKKKLRIKEQNKVAKRRGGKGREPK